MLDKQNLLHT